MRVQQPLPERDDPFVFEHKPSEVNYGGRARFHQAAFPAAEGEDQDFEQRVILSVRRFAELLQAPAAPSPAAALSEPELMDVFFDQWGETPRLTAAAFLNWTRTELAAVAGVYRRLRLHAVEQENALGIPRLSYFVSLAAVTLVSVLISEYFEKQIERLGNVATLARLTLGRCFALAFASAEADVELIRARREKLGATELEAGCRRLLNPFSLGFSDMADTGLVDEILAAANPYQISGRLRARLTALLEEVMSRTRRFEARNLKRSLVEPQAYRALLQSLPDRRHLIKGLRQHRDLRQQLVLENAIHDLRRCLRRCACTQANEDLLPFLANERQLNELYAKPAMRNRVLKKLKAKKSPHAREIKAMLREGLQRIGRSRRAWFGRLSRAELLAELESALDRLGECVSQAEDFRLLRAHYGRDSNHSLEWQGLKLWRAYELIPAPSTRSGCELAPERIWERRRADVDNAFAEGNLFLFRTVGEIYPLAHQRRTRTIFLFADLRNSTETTMRLTKDTASFLAPYLTAVDSEARRCSGERIYFAGDGYAAYYLKPTDAIRTAYGLSGRFYKLRALSSEAHLRKAREILQAVKTLGLELSRPAVIKKALDGSASARFTPEVRTLLEELVACEKPALNEEAVKKALLNVAAEYSMPRVEAGVAITGGELFFAMVGEEGQPKTPIVISPALTQAARLSGSSDLVKKRVEEQYPDGFPFNAMAWDQKLYNRGIIVTEELVEELKQEVEVKPLEHGEKEFKGEKLLSYYDTRFNKRFILRDLQESVALKGIAKLCRVFEVAPPFSLLDKRFGVRP